VVEPPATAATADDQPWREPRTIVDWWDRLFGDDPAEDAVTSEATGSATAEATSATLAAVEGPAAEAGSGLTLASSSGTDDAGTDDATVAPATAPAPAPIKPVVVVPIPEPSVAIEVAQGLVAIPIAKPSATAAVVKMAAVAATPPALVATPASFPMPVAKPVAPGLGRQAIAFAEGETTLSATAIGQLQAVATAAAGREARFQVVGEGVSPAEALDRAVAVAVQLVRLGVSATDVQVQIAEPVTDRDHVVLTMAW
jgi:hypothetical protein